MTFVAFTTEAAQQLVLHREDQVTSFLLEAVEGVSEADLVAAVRIGEDTETVGVADPGSPPGSPTTRCE